MTRNFYIPYGESVLYSCVEITALSEMASLAAISRVVTVLLMVRGPVARLNVRCAVAFSTRAILPN
jgi:hypothetical protein